MRNTLLLTLLAVFAVLTTGCGKNNIGFGRPGPDEVADKIVAKYYDTNPNQHQRLDMITDDGTISPDEDLWEPQNKADTQDQTLESEPKIGNNGDQTVGNIDSPAKDGTVRHYQIIQGDSYWKIARKTLGDPKRWAEIQKLNPSVDMTKLRVGMTLKIPLK